LYNKLQKIIYYDNTSKAKYYQIFCCQPIYFKLNSCFNLGLQA